MRVSIRSTHTTLCLIGLSVGATFSHPVGTQRWVNWRLSQLFWALTQITRLTANGEKLFCFLTLRWALSTTLTPVTLKAGVRAHTHPPRGAVKPAINHTPDSPLRLPAAYHYRHSNTNQPVAVEVGGMRLCVRGLTQFECDVCDCLHDACWVGCHWSVSDGADRLCVCKMFICIHCVLDAMLGHVDLYVQGVCEDARACFLPCLKTPMSRALSASLSHQSAGTSAWNGWGIQISSSLMTEINLSNQC